MQVAFHKMHGAGNDFVVIDARAEPRTLSPASIRALSDRRTGIGFDQLVLIEAGDRKAAAGVQFFNADGTESGACGNGTRCAALLLSGGVPGRTLSLRTRAGLLPALILDAGMVEIGMGEPGLDWRALPLSHRTDTLHLPLAFDPAGCSMGNPHATFFDSRLDPATHGPLLSVDPLFPEGANIGFAEIVSPERMRLMVHERGSGLTPACGTGACAAVVNAVRRGLGQRRMHVEMPGGTLLVDWDADDQVRLTGPAALAYSGSVALG